MLVSPLSLGWGMGRSACDPVCSMVGLSGCFFVVARPCRLGSVLGPDVILCWLALLETFGPP